MTPLISVVVPAYNAQDKIASTLESIIAQDYGNIEIIVVNDASTDGTADAARGALSMCARTWRVIEHEENRGECAARNTGMDAAVGEYVQFFDADDLAEVNFISTLYSLASGNNCDIAFCGFKTRTASTGEETAHPIALDQAKEYTGEELAMRHISGRFVTFVWTMLFRREFLFANELRFWDGCLDCGDMEFMMRAMTRCDRVSFTSECLYIYVQHDKMISRSYVTPEQKLIRHDFRTRGRLRVARYMSEHAKSPAIADGARYMLTPLYHLKMFTVYAWNEDRAAFDKALASKDVRSALWSSRRVFFKEPGIFLKSLWLFAFPNMYYEYRRRHIDYDRV
jgi:glycosyltransferase involved in cell wall biosynthesis